MQTQTTEAVGSAAGTPLASKVTGRHRPERL